MCLELTKKSKKLIAKSDIRCYKIVRNISTSINNERVYITPFQGSFIKLHNTYYSDLTIEPIGFHKYGVFKGIHSYMKIENCFDHINHNPSDFNNCTIIECVIPKGRNYYRGFFKNCGSYASDCIYYNREISKITSK